MGREPVYTSAHALDDLKGKPSETEIERLVEYYPTYQYVHRIQLLQGLFDGESHDELVLGKMTAKGLDTSISKQAKGGHGKWVVAKVRKTVIRLLYLRYRIDDGMTRRQANKQLIKKFAFSEDLHSHQSIIRKYTRSPVLDGCISL